MTALSFKPRFVTAIMLGLGQLVEGSSREPKNLTIRAGAIARDGEARSPKGRLLARWGQPVSLYCQQRSRNGFLIGVGVCRAIQGITIYPHEMSIQLGDRYLRGKKLDKFVRSDGFDSLDDMRQFWAENHPGVRTFNGVVIYWDPHSGKASAS